MSLVKILGMGMYLPTHKQSNDELANLHSAFSYYNEYGYQERRVGRIIKDKTGGIIKEIKFDDAFIKDKTGITHRRISSDEETLVYMGEHAAREALKEANIAPSDLSKIIVASLGRIGNVPSVASGIHAKLKAPTSLSSEDKNCACAGFLSALEHASYLPGYTLVVGTERINDLPPALDVNRMLYAGCSAAMVIGPSNDGTGIVKVTSGTKTDNGEQEALFCLPLSGLMIMPAGKGQVIANAAKDLMCKSSRDVIEKAGWKLEEVSGIIPHQANGNLDNFIADKFQGSEVIINEEGVVGTAEGKRPWIINCIREIGNPGGVSCGVATYLGRKYGVIRPNEKWVITSFGGGGHYCAIAYQN